MFRLHVCGLGTEVSFELIRKQAPNREGKSMKVCLLWRMKKLIKMSLCFLKNSSNEMTIACIVISDRFDFFGYVFKILSFSGKSLYFNPQRHVCTWMPKICVCVYHSYVILTQFPLFGSIQHQITDSNLLTLGGGGNSNYSDQKCIIFKKKC